MNTKNSPHPVPSEQEGATKLNVTLQWYGQSGDGKRAFVDAKENNGLKDLRIEVDTDDCDRTHAFAAMQVVIDRCNSYTAQQSRIAALEGALRDGVKMCASYNRDSSAWRQHLSDFEQSARALLPKEAS